MVLLDPEGRRFFVEWDASAEATVANLRDSADFAVAPARLRELLDRLEAESPRDSRPCGRTMTSGPRPTRRRCCATPPGAC